MIGDSDKDVSRYCRGCWNRPMSSDWLHGSLHPSVGKSVANEIVVMLPLARAWQTAIHP